MSRISGSRLARLSIALVWPMAVVAASLAALPAAAADPQGFIYGKITTRSDSTYEGRMRWGKEEAFWGDHFNSAKENRPYLDQAPKRGRREKESFKIFGITLGTRWEDYSDGRSLIARFGDIRRIEVRRGDEAVLVMKNGTEVEIDGGSNDLGGTVRVWDQEIGEVDVRWSQIETIEFLPTPADLKITAHRLFGRLTSRDGEFNGFIQWDQDECLTTDKLDGETRDGEMSIEMGKIQLLERHTRNSTRVVLRNGRELILDDSNDVDSDNRGIFVEDPRYGRVLVDWDAFESLELMDPETNGPRYQDFAPAKALSGKVTGDDGKVHQGRIVYDLDEVETWEILGGDDGDLEYHIPFSLVASIIPGINDSSRVVLRSGEKLDLEDSADVGDNHDGILVLDGEESEPVFLAWNEVRRIDFDP